MRVARLGLSAALCIVVMTSGAYYAASARATKSCMLFSLDFSFAPDGGWRLRDRPGQGYDVSVSINRCRYYLGFDQKRIGTELLIGDAEPLDSRFDVDKVRMPTLNDVRNIIFQKPELCLLDPNEVLSDGSPGNSIQDLLRGSVIKRTLVILGIEVVVLCICVGGYQFFQIAKSSVAKGDGGL